MPQLFIQPICIPSKGQQPCIHLHPFRTTYHPPLQHACRRRTRACADAPRAPKKPPQLTRQILALSLPALGALALDPLLSLIDTAFVGRIGVSALAGVGLSSIILSVSFSVFNFLSISTTPLVATALHSDADPAAHASRVIAVSLMLALSLGLLSASLVIPFAPHLCSLLGATPAARPHAIVYLRTRMLAAPFALSCYVANGALRGFQDLTTPFYMAVIANLTNVTLDVLFIFHFHLGVFGAALATSISQLFAMCLMLTSLILTKRLHVSHLATLPSRSELSPVGNAAVMLCLRTMSILLTVAYATSTAARLGVLQLAAYELCRQLWIFNATILDSFATAAQALVASAMAINSISRARDIAKRAILLSAVFGFILALLAVLADTRLPGLFTTSPPVMRIAADCIRVAAICAPLNAMVFALDAVMAACSDFTYMAIGIAIASALACAALTVVRVCGGDVVWVWGGLNLLMLGRAVVTFWRFWGSKTAPISAARIPASVNPVK